MLEAISACNRIAGRELDWNLAEHNRIGDHRWWVSDLGAFKRDFPGWDITYSIDDILVEIRDRNTDAWTGAVR